MRRSLCVAAVAGLTSCAAAAASAASLQSTCINTIAGGFIAPQPVGNPTHAVLDQWGSPLVTTPAAVFRVEADGITLTALAGNGTSSGYVDGLGPDARFNVRCRGAGRPPMHSPLGSSADLTSVPGPTRHRRVGALRHPRSRPVQQRSAGHLPQQHRDDDRGSGP